MCDVCQVGGRRASVSLSPSDTLTCARYVHVPSLCANESWADLRRRETHTHTILTGGKRRRGRRRGGLAFPLIPPSNTSPPFVRFHSFVSSFRFVPFHVLSVRLRLFSRPPFSLCSILFPPSSRRSPFFPIHRLFLLASLPFPSAAPVTAQGVRRAEVGSL